MAAPSTIAHYRITSKLGQGGMGEVWRATDTKLHREVAIKILPEAFAEHPDRMARFEREAQLLASLNHPNIASIYGVEDRAIVLELVEGPTLAERIAQGPIELAEALDIARQIGDALDAAHQTGIVHRDLKPANIKVTPEGRVKVLDFGLAKATSGESTSSDPVQSPTLTMRATAADVILGTAAYMAPEQAKGRTVDKRADVWAFGVVLFEMLTGQPLFSGETVSDTLAAVLTKEPDFKRVPAEIRDLLRSCLERDPKRRLRDIGDVWRLVRGTPPQAAVQSARKQELPWIAAACCAAAACVFAAIHYTEQPLAVPVIRFSVPAPAKATFNGWLSLSPDGKYLAFLATGMDGAPAIWLRRLDSLETQPVATAGPTTVTTFWSPDSRYIVYQAGGKLKKVSIAGGSSQSLCDAPPVILGGSWSRGGVILFGSNIGPIMRVSAAGGTASAVTQLESSRGETFHTDPMMLPDGNHFLCFRHSSKPSVQGIYVGSLDTKPDEQSRDLIQSVNFSPAYAPAGTGKAVGRLLFIRDEALVTMAFDEQRLRPVGDPTTVTERVGTSITRAFFSVSNNGVLAYRGAAGVQEQLTWYDRQGRVVAANQSGVDYVDLAMSPDESKVAYTRTVPGGTRQIWMFDIARRTETVRTQISVTAASRFGTLKCYRVAHDLSSLPISPKPQAESHHGSGIRCVSLSRLPEKV